MTVPKNHNINMKCLFNTIPKNCVNYCFVKEDNPESQPILLIYKRIKVKN